MVAGAREMSDSMNLEEMVNCVVEPDWSMAKEARERQQTLTKPPGSLGELEAVAAQVAAVTRRCPPLIPRRPEILLFASDHGVALDGVTPWPQSVTAQMVLNIARGGAAINAIARVVGASLHVIDVGVATDFDGTNAVVDRKVRRGTSSLAQGPAMTLDEARRSIEVGFEFTKDRCQAGADLIVPGDMGIGNTTASAATIASLTQSSAQLVTGRGTGIDDEHFARKVSVIEDALARLSVTEQGSEGDALRTLASLGGFEIGAIAGAILAASSSHVPVVIDGVIALAGALVAVGLQPLVRDYCVAGHRSTEPAASIALRSLELSPLLDLALRLGEGTGAALAVPIVQAACATLLEMATFEGAGVSQA